MVKKSPGENIDPRGITPLKMPVIGVPAA